MRKIIGAIFIIICAVAVLLFVKHEPASAPILEKTEQTSTEENDSGENVLSATKYSLDDPTSPWVIVNKQRSLNPKEYRPSDLISVGGGQQLRSQAADALKSLMEAAKREGLSIQPLSGYRSYTTQVTVYEREVATYGQSVADSQSARPGHSEHQTGLSIDVGGGGCGIEDCFGDTAEGKWLAKNAHTYGFIIRYPEGKQSVTGYRYEPWHIRYVGMELSTEMKKQGVETLEEYFQLPAAANY